MLRHAALAFTTLFALAPLGVPVTALDLDLYDRLLQRHTREVADIATVRVDYAALVDSEEWADLVDGLEATDVDALRGREAFAFWVNAYNILAIEVVRRSYPVESIKDVGSLWKPVWKREAARIDGRPYTLDQIEHEILRPMGDPRVHGAIVCASLSCPPLRREAYRVEELDAQLDDNVRVWLRDPRKGVRVDAARQTLHLSPILKWFAKDFQAAGGRRGFVQRYGPPEAVALLEREPDARLGFLDYDWRLNDLAEAG